MDGEAIKAKISSRANRTSWIVRRGFRVAVVGALLMSATGAGACSSIPKVWLDDTTEDGMRRLDLMAELPEGCAGHYQITLQREHDGNRNASKQAGELPTDQQGPVALSSMSINDLPEANLTIGIEVTLDDGMVIRQTIETAGK